MSATSETPSVPGEYTIELEGEDGPPIDLDTVDLENLWSSAPPKGWVTREGEIGLARPEGYGIQFRQTCARMLATSLSAAHRHRVQTGVYYVRGFPKVEPQVVLDHVQAIFQRAKVHVQVTSEHLEWNDSKYIGKVVGPVSVLDALASEVTSLLQRVDQIPPTDLRECFDLIATASRDENPLLHELAWASTIRLYKVLGPLLEMVPPALAKARAQGRKIGVLQRPDGFTERLCGIMKRPGPQPVEIRQGDEGHHQESTSSKSSSS